MEISGHPALRSPHHRYGIVNISIGITDSGTTTSEGGHVVYGTIVEKGSLDDASYSNTNDIVIKIHLMGIGDCCYIKRSGNDDALNLLYGLSCVCSTIAEKYPKTISNGSGISGGVVGGGGGSRFCNELW